MYLYLSIYLSSSPWATAKGAQSSQVPLTNYISWSNHSFWIIIRRRYFVPISPCIHCPCYIMAIPDSHSNRNCCQLPLQLTETGQRECIHCVHSYRQIVVVVDTRAHSACTHTHNSISCLMSVPILVPFILHPTITLFHFHPFTQILSSSLQLYFHTLFSFAMQFLSSIHRTHCLRVFSH